MERMVGDGRLDGGAQESLLNPFLLSNCRGHFFKKKRVKRGRQATASVEYWDGVLWSMEFVWSRGQTPSGGACLC